MPTSDRAPITPALPSLRCSVMDRAALFERASRAGNFHTFGSPETLDVPPPDAVQVPHRMAPPLRDKVGPFEFPQPFVAELSGVTLVGSRAVPVCDDGAIVLENAINRSDVLAMSLPVEMMDPGFAIQEVVPARTLPLVCSLVNRWSRNYFHWMIESLTRLEALEHAGLTGEEKPFILIDADAPPWQRDSLRRMGICADHIIECDGQPIRAERLIVPSLRRESGRTSPAAMRWLSSCLTMAATEQWRWRPHTGDRIYISRSAASKRRVVNEPDLLDLLTSRGFQICRLEEMTLEQQIHRFSHASTIVAPHGAGLANLAWAKNATVLELFGRHVSAIYMTLAAAAGHRYTFLSCPAHGEDLFVDPHALLSALGAMESFDFPSNGQSAAI